MSQWVCTLNCCGVAGLVACFALGCGYHAVMLNGFGPHGRVLVRLPSWLGDLVMAEPCLGALVDAVGEERVSVAGPQALLSVLDGLYPGVRRIGHAGRSGALAAEWRGHGLALLFTNSFRSAWTAWRAGIPRRVGWARDGRTLLLTDGVRPALERGGVPLGLGIAGAGRRYLPRPFGATCIELLGRVGLGVSRTRPRLVASEAGKVLANARLARLGLGEDAGFVLASVGARPDSAKAYPTDRWAAVLDALAAQQGAPGLAPRTAPDDANPSIELAAPHGQSCAAAPGALLPVLLVAGPGEEASVERVRMLSKHPRLLPVCDPVASLPELVALAMGARAALSTDGGVRHVIAACGTPQVVVFGPTDPRHTADHLGMQALVRQDVACGPCHLERCPMQGDELNLCMRGIGGEQLAAQLHRLIQLDTY